MIKTSIPTLNTLIFDGEQTKLFMRKLFTQTKKPLLNIYFTAGYPSLNDTGKIILALQAAGVDCIEIGMPYSDPLADGETIQKSSSIALKNGMTLDLLFNQLIEIKDQVDIPLIFMGYLNQWLQYGEEKFCKKLIASGITTVIIPDLPLSIYKKEYQSLLKKYGLTISFLITPQTAEKRIKKAAALSSAFLYIVSQSSITGTHSVTSPEQQQYFKRIKNMNLNIPSMIGFGINSSQAFLEANKYADGAIIGSGFIKALDKNNLEGSIQKYVKSILKNNP